MLNELLSSVLNGAVGNNLNNDPSDVLSVKNGLRDAGFIDLDTTPEPHGYYTRDLDNGIKAFQRDNDLRIDGRLFPNGETERELFLPSRDMQTLERDYDVKYLAPRFYEPDKRPNPDPGFSIPNPSLPPFSLHGEIRDFYDNDPRDIRNLRDHLERYGYLNEPRNMYQHTGIYDGETRDALKKFQQDLGIRIDGKMQPGKTTEAGLNAVNTFQKLSNVNVSPEQSIAAINGIIGALRGGQSDAQRLGSLTPAISTALGALDGGAGGALGGIANVANTALTIAQAVLSAKDAIKGDGDILTKISQLVPAVTSGISGISGAAKDLELTGDRVDGITSLSSAEKTRIQNLPPQRGEEEGVLVSYIQARQNENAAQSSNTQSDVISGEASDDTLHGQQGQADNSKTSLTTPPIPQIKPENIPVPGRKPKGTALQKGLSKKLLDVIGGLESSDNYNVIVGGEEKPLTSMTIKEVRQLQKERNDQNLGTAVGRYQIIDDKMGDLVRWMNINEGVVFDEKMQDEMGKELLRRRGLEKFENGQISEEELIKNISKEWAALPKDSSNQSYYRGVGNNKSHIDFETLKGLLKNQ